MYIAFSPQDVIINEFLIENKGENNEFTEEERKAVHDNDIRRLKKCVTTAVQKSV